MAQAADKNMRRALADKQLSQANTYLRQRNQFNSEIRHLNELLNPTTPAIKQKKPKLLDHKEIKDKIKKYNKKALEADTQMRVALKDKKLEKANELLQQRNYLNAEAKKLTVLIEKQNNTNNEKKSITETAIEKKETTPIKTLVNNTKKKPAKKELKEANKKTK